MGLNCLIGDLVVLKNEKDGYIFSLFRIVFSLYIFISYWLVINSGEIFQPGFSSYPWAEKVLHLLGFYSHYKIFVFLILISALFVMIGLYRNVAALLCWLSMLPLSFANDLIINPGIGMTGYLLLMIFFIPPGEKGSLDYYRLKKEKFFRIPSKLFYATYILLFYIYLNAAIAKIGTSSWLNGVNMMIFIKMFSSELFRDLLRNIPQDYLRGLALGVVGMYFATVLFLTPFLRVRRWLNVIFIIYHGGIFLFFQIKEVSFVMMLVHLFVCLGGRDSRSALAFFNEKLKSD